MIGVVAGVGPFAGLDLLAKIAGQTLADNDQDHLPVLSISAPGEIGDRTAYLLNRKGPNPGLAIAKQLGTLAEMGATIAGIPCNTAHAPAIYEVIQANAPSSLRLIHMIEEVSRYLARSSSEFGTIGVMSTTGTRDSGIYDFHLKKRGLLTVNPSKSFQNDYIHAAIYDPVYGIKATGRATNMARKRLYAAAHHLIANGAQALILGCTEIPLALDEPHIDGIPAVDPTLILARALIREAFPTKLRPESPESSSSKHS